MYFAVSISPMTHLSSRLVVVQIHLAASIAFDLTHVQKLSGEPDAKVDVDRAPSPLPRLNIFTEREETEVD